MKNTILKSLSYFKLDIFALKTLPEKRVAIAKDCLASLNSGRIGASKGIFLGKYFPEKQSLKKIIKEQHFSCPACAKGSLFLSYVAKVNNFNTSDLSVSNNYSCTEDSAPMRKLTEIFTMRQLHMIEFFFEGRYFSRFEGYDLAKFKNEVERFNDLGFTPREKLQIILKNIIANKGEFHPRIY